MPHFDRDICNLAPHLWPEVSEELARDYCLVNYSIPQYSAEPLWQTILLCFFNHTGQHKLSSHGCIEPLWNVRPRQGFDGFLVGTKLMLNPDDRTRKVKMLVLLYPTWDRGDNPTGGPRERGIDFNAAQLHRDIAFLHQEKFPGRFIERYPVIVGGGAHFYVYWVTASEDICVDGPLDPAELELDERWNGIGDTTPLAGDDADGNTQKEEAESMAAEEAETDILTDTEMEAETQHKTEVQTEDEKEDDSKDAAKDQTDKPPRGSTDDVPRMPGPMDIKWDWIVLKQLMRRVQRVLYVDPETIEAIYFGD